MISVVVANSQRRRALLIVALALLFGARCSSPTTQPSAPASRETRAERAPEKQADRELTPVAAEESSADNQEDRARTGPFRAHLAIDKLEFAVGEPVVLRYRIQNVDKQDATIWISGFWPNHRVRLVHQDGRPATPTAFGKQCDAAFRPGGSRDKNVRHELQPQATYDQFAPININRLFQLPPDTYRAQVEYHETAGPTPAHVISDEVTFRVGA